MRHPRLRAAMLPLAILLFVRTAEAAVPTVACASDGQGGPVPPPTSITKVPPVSEPAASNLAYYASGTLGVLAPRGWHCFGLYGSNGDQLLVTPELHDARDLFNDPQPGLTGPAVQLMAIAGDTSGRFIVARVAARLFPAARAYVQAVIAEDIEPRSSFVFGPYRTDLLTRHGPYQAEFQTPADTTGIGTQSRLVRNHDPIAGVATLFPKDSMNMVAVFVRLPPESQPLVPVIVQAVERAPRKP